MTAHSTVTCDMLRMMLDCAGIKSIMKNETISTWMGFGFPFPSMAAPTFAWPEVWVADEDYEEAVKILEEMKNAKPSSAGPWECANCGETVNPELDECWNCGKICNDDKK